MNRIKNTIWRNKIAERVNLNADYLIGGIIFNAMAMVRFIPFLRQSKVGIKHGKGMDKAWIVHGKGSKRFQQHIVCKRF